MNRLLEDPTTILIVGAVIEVLLGVVFFNTNNIKVLYGMGGVLVGVILLVILETVVVTDREEIADVLTQITHDLESNKVERVRAHIAPNELEMISRVNALLPSVTINRAVFTSLEVVVHRDNQPPTATAEFIGKIEGKYNLGDSFFGTYLRRFIIYFRLEGNKWLVTDYEDLPFNDDSRAVVE